MSFYISVIEQMLEGESIKKNWHFGVTLKSEYLESVHSTPYD